MRVLVTNDDGIGSPGLHALVGAIAADEHDVVIAAPAADRSGFGAAIGPLHLSGEIAFERAEGLCGVEAVAVDGPPALAVLAGCLGGFGPRPDVVVSGINAGPNTGRAVLHSGTVGAALTAVNFGVPAIAVSLAVDGGHHWMTAAEAAASLVPWVAARPMPLALNVNVPDLSPDAVEGVTVASLEAGGIVQSVMEETRDGVLQMRLSGPRTPTPGSDTALLADGYITVTGLLGLHAVELSAPVARLRGVLARHVVGAAS
jgi:5'/3'-nucleotidase